MKLDVHLNHDIKKAFDSFKLCVLYVKFLLFTWLITKYPSLMFFPFNLELLFAHKACISRLIFMCGLGLLLFDVVVLSDTQ